MLSINTGKLSPVSLRISAHISSPAAVRSDKYSRRLIVGEFGDELWKTTIIRRDMQTYGEMLTLISKTETPDGITELNEQNALPWE